MGQNIQVVLTYLERALRSEFGIVVATAPHDLAKMKARFYSARQTDVRFAAITILTSREHPTTELWLRKEIKPRHLLDPNIPTP